MLWQLGLLGRLLGGYWVATGRLLGGYWVGYWGYWWGYWVATGATGRPSILGYWGYWACPLDYAEATFSYPVQCTYGGDLFTKVLLIINSIIES